MPKDEKKQAAGPPYAGELELKDRGLAAFLAWLIPGAGHFYQGRHAKAGIFLVCILGTFLFGLSLGNGRVVYAQWNPPKFRRYPFLCQLGVGLPSLPAVVASVKAGRTPAGEETTLFGTRWYVPPKIEIDRQENEYVSRELDELHRQLGRRFELGTVFTMVAGLLNVLAIYDAWGGPAYGLRGPPGRKEEDEDNSSEGAFNDGAKPPEKGQD